MRGVEAQRVGRGRIFLLGEDGNQHAVIVEEFGVFEVGNGLVGAESFAVGSGEGGVVFVGGRCRFGLGFMFGFGLFFLFGFRLWCGSLRGGFGIGCQAGNVLFQLAAGKGRQFAGIGTAQELDAGERVVVGQLHGVFAAFGGQGGFQVACNALAQFAAELFFGQIAQHGNVAFEYIAAGKHAHTRALAQRKQAGSSFGQFFVAGFKQLVAWVGLQQVAQVVLLMAAIGKIKVF